MKKIFLFVAIMASLVTLMPMTNAMDENNQVQSPPDQQNSKTQKPPAFHIGLHHLPTLASIPFSLARPTTGNANNNLSHRRSKSNKWSNITTGVRRSFASNTAKFIALKNFLSLWNTPPKSFASNTAKFIALKNFLSLWNTPPKSNDQLTQNNPIGQTIQLLGSAQERQDANRNTTTQISHNPEQLELQMQRALVALTLDNKPPITISLQGNHLTATWENGIHSIIFDPNLLAPSNSTSLVDHLSLPKDGQWAYLDTLRSPSEIQGNRQSTNAMPQLTYNPNALTTPDPLQVRIPRTLLPVLAFNKKTTKASNRQQRQHGPAMAVITPPKYEDNVKEEGEIPEPPKKQPFNPTPTQLKTQEQRDKAWEDHVIERIEEEFLSDEQRLILLHHSAENFQKANYTFGRWFDLLHNCLVKMGLLDTDEQKRKLHDLIENIHNNSENSRQDLKWRFLPREEIAIPGKNNSPRSIIEQSNDEAEGEDKNLFDSSNFGSESDKEYDNKGSSDEEDSESESSNNTKRSLQMTLRSTGYGTPAEGRLTPHSRYPFNPNEFHPIQRTPKSTNKSYHQAYREDQQNWEKDVFKGVLNQLMGITDNKNLENIIDYTVASINNYEEGSILNAMSQFVNDNGTLNTPSQQARYNRLLVYIHSKAGYLCPNNLLIMHDKEQAPYFTDSNNEDMAIDAESPPMYITRVLKSGRTNWHIQLDADFVRTTPTSIVSRARSSSSVNSVVPSIRRKTPRSSQNIDAPQRIQDPAQLKSDTPSDSDMPELVEPPRKLANNGAQQSPLQVSLPQKPKNNSNGRQGKSSVYPYHSPSDAIISSTTKSIVKVSVPSIALCALFKYRNDLYTYMTKYVKALRKIFKKPRIRSAKVVSKPKVPRDLSSPVATSARTAARPTTANGRES